jgi:tetratricopeptide (TPR) repeat protein
MTGHPDRGTLEAFLFGLLPSEEGKGVLTHLLSGCRSCRESLGPLTAALFLPGEQEEVALTPEEDAAYDAAISAAFAKALFWREERLVLHEDVGGKIRRLLRGELPVEASFWTVNLCTALLEQSRDLRHQPADMLRLAVLARDVAERLEPAPSAGPEIADLRARAWAELANAWRANDDMAEAETAMMRALELQSQGTGSELLLARLADLSASLFCDQRRFDEAFQMLDTAYGLYERLGSAHDAGRVLVMKGLYTGYTGNAELGLRILSQGLASIDRDRDPRLTFRTLHNILLFRVELGDLAEARRQLDRMRHLYDRYAGPHEWVKLRSIEGKIAAGLGDLPRAEELLRGVRNELDAAGLGYQAAIITLDLASVCLQLGKTAEVRRLVQEMVETFGSVGVEREAMAALTLLSEAVEQEVTTVGLIARVAGVLQRLERGPGLLVRTDQD